MKKIGIIMANVLIICTVFAQDSKDVFTVKRGDYEICLLSEGQQTGQTGILKNATPEMLREYVPEGAFPNSCNAFLIKMSGKMILVDTGFGRKLFDNLKSLGVEPSQIDILLLTHMHGDHIGGMLRDGAKAFPNADVYIARKEHDYWNSKEIMNGFPENRQGGFQNAQKVIETYGNRVKLFDPDEINGSSSTLLPGIRAIAAYGHTPGHTMFLVDSGGQKILIWGNLTHAMAIQMPHPEVAVTYDVDPDNATTARQKTLKFVEENKIPIAGMHIAFPGMGEITKNNKGGYVFTPLK